MMKTVGSMLFAAAMMFSAAPANAVVLDLSTMTCKQFLESGDDAIKMVLTWMDGWYKGDSDEAIIDTDVFVENAKKFGAYCGKIHRQHRQRRRGRPRQVTQPNIANALDTIATGLLSAALESVTRPKLMVRPRRTTRASASRSEADAARMKCVVWSTVVIIFAPRLAAKLATTIAVSAKAIIA